MIAHNPLHRSGLAGLPHPAPALGDDAKSPERVGVTDVGRRKPAINQPKHPCPIQSLFLTTAPKREVPVATDLEPKVLDGPVIGGHSVVAREAANHRTQPSSLYGNRHMHTLSEVGFNLLKFPAQPFANRLA